MGGGGYGKCWRHQGGGVAQCWQGGGGGGVKFVKILLTSYVNAPLVFGYIANIHLYIAKESKFGEAYVFGSWQ